MGAAWCEAIEKSKSIADAERSEVSFFTVGKHTWEGSPSDTEIADCADEAKQSVHVLWCSEGCRCEKHLAFDDEDHCANQFHSSGMARAPSDAGRKGEVLGFPWSSDGDAFWRHRLPATQFCLYRGFTIRFSGGHFVIPQSHTCPVIWEDCCQPNCQSKPANVNQNVNLEAPKPPFCQPGEDICQSKTPMKYGKQRARLTESKKQAFRDWRVSRPVRSWTSRIRLRTPLKIALQSDLVMAAIRRRNRQWSALSAHLSEPQSASRWISHGRVHLRSRRHVSGDRKAGRCAQRATHWPDARQLCAMELSRAGATP